MTTGKSLSYQCLTNRMEYLNNNYTSVSTRYKFPVMRVGSNGATLNSYASALIKHAHRGVKFYNENGDWFVEFVDNLADKTTFSLSVNGSSATINGKAINRSIDEGYYELLEHGNDVYELVKLN